MVLFHDIDQVFSPHHLNWGRVAKAFEQFVDSLDAGGVGTALVDHNLPRQSIDIPHSGEELGGDWFVATP